MNTIPTIKSTLIIGLDERRAKALAFVNPLSPDHIVHEDTGWTVKDLISHLTAFEADMIEAIQMFLDGEKYHLDLRGQASIDGFNEIRRQEYAHKTWEQALDEWQMVRDQLRGVVIAFPESQLDTPFSTPFLQKNTLVQAIKGCGIHEKIHLREIMEATTHDTDA